MTVKLKHLQYAETSINSDVFVPSASWKGVVDLLPTAMDSGWGEWIALPMIRGIFRDRGDITDMPYIMGFVYLSKPDEWGNNLKIHVRYNNRRNWQAVYAASLADPSAVQCYMD